MNLFMIRTCLTSVWLTDSEAANDMYWIYPLKDIFNFDCAKRKRSTDFFPCQLYFNHQSNPVS